MMWARVEKDKDQHHVAIFLMLILIYNSAFN